MKLAQRLLLLLLLAATGLCVHAQQQARRIVSSDNSAIIVQNPLKTLGQTADSQEALQSFVMNNAPKASINLENEDAVTVTTVFDCNEEDFMTFFCMYRFMNDKKQFFTLYGYEGNTIALPKGKYDIIAQYSGNNGKTFYVIREQVDITNDTTIATNPEEANVHIKFQPRYPNGELCRPATLLIHEDYSNEVIEEGNLAFLEYADAVIEKESGRVFTGVSGNWGENYTGYWEGDDAAGRSDMYVNALSDRFVLTCTMLICPNPQDGNFYQVNFQTEASKDSVVTNEAYEYVSIDVPFKQSPIGKANGETMKACVRDYVYDAAQPQMGRQPGDMFAYELQDGESCRYSICNAFDGKSWMVNTIQPVALDGMNQDQYYYSTYDQRFWLDNGKLRFLNTGISSAYSIIHYYFQYDDSAVVGWSYMPEITYPGNPIYSYDCDKRKTITGNSCPILIPDVNGRYDRETGNIGRDVEFLYYLGRNGEIRERDFFLLQSSIKVDGENILDEDEQNVNTFGWIENADTHGVVDITVTNDDVDVDGLAGKNVSTIHFDMASDDPIAPMLQMLDFRDTEDNAIDRFATAAEGKLQFYCGDFNDQYLYISSYDYYRQFFVCDDLASVEVAYSPYQADTWTTLDASEVAEYYYNGMGHYYAAPLANVTGQGLEGWFDLKIRLEDAAGNWQEQVISPAFRIDDLAYSSVATVGNENAREVARYNLAGQRVDGNAKGVVIVKMSDGTARKIITP